MTDKEKTLTTSLIALVNFIKIGDKHTKEFIKNSQDEMEKIKEFVALQLKKKD